MVITHRLIRIVAVGLLSYAQAAAQRPTPDQQKKTLDAAREIAIHYSSKLPDFICTEDVERTDRTSNTNIKIDRLAVQLSYFGQKEKYKLLTINNAKTTQSFESLDGLISAGEFGSLLLGVFDPSSAADFTWKSATDLRKHPAAVYTYKIARAQSHYMLGSRAAAGNLVAVAAGYHGEVVLDSETNRVLKLTAVADDIPAATGILQSTVEVDYDFIDVAGRNYLLPSHSESRMERQYRQISNLVTFAGYRKFEADSTIDFGPPKQ